MRRRWDATTVAASLGVLFGVAWLLGATDATRVSVEAAAALGLLLLGASLVVTARTDWSLSRRSWPLWLGLCLVAVLVATSSTFGIRAPLQDVSFGDKSVVLGAGTPGRPSTVHGGFGNLTVDATGMVGGGSLAVENVAGEIHVRVPEGVALEVTSHVLAGQICYLGKARSDGIGASLQRTDVPDPAAPTLSLDVHEVLGQIVIGPQGCAPR